ncbi:thioredoxin fold domain-containing protein [Maribellus comscasis]|uniref:Thioredoxin fold domain-containing protein n=1 Tax=Maribellus comscasis TaxID=2681766 RepID=A0A6I6JMP0_9BACT|nr:thioredoxin family protein [Maribellus comscasis]QGY44206.1 thioredoxin fold domain-containing protein [Maribellus comscasis]
MKKLILIASAIFVVNTIHAQKWETNFETAKKRASEERKNILLVFSGSDWCIPCMKLEKEIWESQDFIKDSEEHFVLLRADFPKRKANKLSKEQQEQNNRLAETYNKKGLFPMVEVLDKNGNVLGTTGYKNVSPKDYIVMLHSFEK